MQINDRELVSRAIKNDRKAMQTISQFVDPIINHQTSRFCRKYCYEQNRVYQCSLVVPLKGVSGNALLCEWGNASYGWMHNELCKAERLEKYDATNNARLVDYFFVIANSSIFFERWKDWRFENHIYVPSYIDSMHLNARAVFRCLKRQMANEEIAVELHVCVDEITRLSRKIFRELLKRGRMYLLVADKNTSMDQMTEQQLEQDVFSVEPLLNSDFRQTDAVNKSFTKLDPLQQFVLSSFYIEELPAKQVLKTLQKIEWPGSGQYPEFSDLQQLYYYKRKCIHELYQVFSVELEQRKPEKNDNC